MPKVLIVDDVAVDRRLAGGFLEKAPHFEIQYAENGAEALQQMQAATPDLVVTDMQMPEMDGLELVTKVRMIHPKVPVILMTAQGSESVAMEALQRGASSYVPKSQLNDMLLGTVEELLSLADTDKTYDKLMACQQKIELNYVLENDVALIDALIDLIQQMIGGVGITDHTGKFRVGVAVHEALLNAMYRGNLEISFDQMQEASEKLLAGEGDGLVQQRRSQQPYADRKIHVEIKVDPEEARFTIRDEGPGFDNTAAFNSGDLSTIGSMEGKQGRGLVLMRSFMDEVNYNDVGNEVTMVKRRDH